MKMINSWISFESKSYPCFMVKLHDRFVKDWNSCVSGIELHT